jgi:hypothetical protein
LNPKPPPIIEHNGFKDKPVRYPLNPTPRHPDHEPHKPDHTALTQSMPNFTRIRDTLDLCGANPHPDVTERYKPKTHSWYHPMARRAQDMLLLGQGPRSHAMDIKKSHDHIGYGNGILDCGEVQGTALSVDFPDWGSGPRQVPGPYGTQGLKGDRVGRFTKPVIENGTQRTLVPYYTRGPNLSIHEAYFDPDDLPPPGRGDGGGVHLKESFWDRRKDDDSFHHRKDVYDKEHDTMSRRSSKSAKVSSNAKSKPGVVDPHTGKDPFKAPTNEYNYANQYKEEVRSHSGSSCASDYGWKQQYYGCTGNARQFGQRQFTAGVTQKSIMHGAGASVKRNFIPYSNFIEMAPTIHQHA